MEDPRWIGEQRRKLGMTQQQLARMAGVSQSLVAKIERGSVDAAYSKVKAITEALSRVSIGKEKLARDIMHRGVQAASVSDTLHSAAAKMNRAGISQMPVSEEGKLVGSISEQAILAKFSSGKNIAKMAVREAMEGAFPSVPPNTPLSSIASLLRHHGAVLVLERGAACGIITKADVLKSV